MGFFSKLFGNNESGQPAATQQPVVTSAAPAVQPLNLNATEVVALLGGKGNIIEAKVCAFTRVRVQLKAPVSGIDKALRKTGVSASMEVNDHVIHLLAGLQAEAANNALNAELAG